MANDTQDPRNLPSRNKVIVRRRWHSPEIHAFIDSTQVGASIDLQDFVRALVDEIFGEKNRMMLPTKAAVLEKALLASDEILLELKQATQHVA